MINSRREAIFSNELNAKYLITTSKKAVKIQPIAQNYLFDCLILAIIKNKNEIEKLSQKNIDGVIFKKELL